MECGCAAVLFVMSEFTLSMQCACCRQHAQALCLDGGAGRQPAALFCYCMLKGHMFALTMP